MRGDMSHGEPQHDLMSSAVPHEGSVRYSVTDSFFSESLGVDVCGTMVIVIAVVVPRLGLVLDDIEMRREYRKSPVVNVFAVGSIVAVRLTAGSAPTRFACCWRARLRLVFRSSARPYLAMLDEMPPTIVMTTPRMVIDTII